MGQHGEQGPLMLGYGAENSVIGPCTKHVKRLLGLKCDNSKFNSLLNNTSIWEKYHKNASQHKNMQTTTQTLKKRPMRDPYL